MRVLVTFLMALVLFAGSSAKAAGTNDNDAAAPATAASTAATTPPAPASTAAPATATTAAAPATPAEARVESELQQLRELLEAQGKQFQEQNELLKEQLKGEEEKTRALEEQLNAVSAAGGSAAVASTIATPAAIGPVVEFGPELGDQQRGTRRCELAVRRGRGRTPIHTL